MCFCKIFHQLHIFISNSVSYNSWPVSRLVEEATVMNSFQSSDFGGKRGREEDSSDLLSY